MTVIDPYRGLPKDHPDHLEIEKLREYMLLVAAAERCGVPHLEACRHMYATVYGHHEKGD